MSFSDNKLSEVIHRGNKPLTVGIIWSIFGITICPCPLCLIGSISFLSFGIVDKLGFARYINAKSKETHEHCNCKVTKNLYDNQISE